MCVSVCTENLQRNSLQEGSCKISVLKDFVQMTRKKHLWRSSTRTQSQLYTATPISSFFQCHISFRLFAFVSRHVYFDRSFLYGIHFWAKVFRFHIERWPEWDSYPLSCTFCAHALTTELSGRTLSCA